MVGADDIAKEDEYCTAADPPTDGDPSARFRYDATVSLTLRGRLTCDDSYFCMRWLTFFG